MSFKYKLVKNPLTGEIDSITHNIDSGHKQSIPIVVDNTDYQQFLEDVIGVGITCVEGPTVGVTTAYNIARQTEYPPIEDQLDKIYHSGVNAWKADIKVIKDKYPKTQVGVTTVAAVPSWVQTAADEKKASDQKISYLSAVERLKQPRIKLGTPYTERVWNPSFDRYDESIKYRDVPAADDPAVVSDEAERVAAQATIDGTPQSIIDSINT